MVDEKLIDSLDSQVEDCVIKNRRKGNDFILNIVNLFSYFVWGILLILPALCQKARVGISNLKYITRQNMELDFAKLALNFSIVVFVLSFTLLMLSFKRCRRRGDKIKTSLFFGEIVSFFVGVYFLLKLYH